MKRYTPKLNCCDDDMAEDPDGNWVKLADVKELLEDLGRPASGPLRRIYDAINARPDDEG